MLELKIVMNMCDLGLIVITTGMGASFQIVDMLLAFCGKCLHGNHCETQHHNKEKRNELFHVYNLLMVRFRCFAARRICDLLPLNYLLHLYNGLVEETGYNFSKYFFVFHAQFGKKGTIRQNL